MQWYTPIHECFARYCASRSLGLADNGKDIMQDAILSALEQWPTIEQKDRLLSYMIGIVNHRLHNQLRSAAVHRKFVAERQRQLTERLPSSPEIALDLHHLLLVIDRLPEASRESLLLHTVSGFSIREVAELQQVSEAAVKTRISRARARLRKYTEAEQRLSLTDRLHTLTAILL